MMKWTIVHFIIEIQVRFGEQVHDDSLSESRGSTVLIKTFESLDLGLAGLGLYNLHIDHHLACCLLFTIRPLTRS
jgi:hypothetical protein